MESIITQELIRLVAYFFFFLLIIYLFLPDPDVDYFSKSETERICRMIARDEAEDIALDTISSHIIGEH